MTRLLAMGVFLGMHAASCLLFQCHGFEWECVVGLHKQVWPKYMRSFMYTIDCSGVSEPNFDLVFNRFEHLVPLLGIEGPAMLDSNNLMFQENRDLQAKGEGWILTRPSRGNCLHSIATANPVSRVFPDEQGHCPWVAAYGNYRHDDDDQDRTLVLTEVGAHFHSVHAFREMMDRYVSLIQRNQRIQ
jgi:hypothetical protein